MYRLYTFRFLLLLFACHGIHLEANAQDRQEMNEAMFVKVRHYLIRQQPDSIYALAGTAFKNKISRQAFSGFAAGLLQLGKLEESSFLFYVGGISSWKLEFSEESLQMSLGLDSVGRIGTLFFKPYQDSVENKTYAVRTSNRSENDFDRRIDTVARTYIQKENTVGLSIGILQGDILTTYAYGSTAKDLDKLPTEGTLYEIGSISKTFTSLLLAYYATTGHVSLSDRVIMYLPDSVALNTALRDITLLMLSNHTSGLPKLPGNLFAGPGEPLNPYKNYSQSRMFSWLKEAKLSSVPGKEYAYSNLGAALLGVILEKVSGKTYEQMVKDIICSPLKMGNTTQHLSELQKEKMVKVYNESGTQTPAWDFQAMAPAGALRSSVYDLLVYSRAYMAGGDSPLSEAMHKTKEASFNNGTTVGLGWHMRKNGDSYTYFHNGGTYGSSSFLAFVPDKRIAVVVLSNAASSVDETGGRLLTLLLQMAEKQ